MFQQILYQVFHRLFFNLLEPVTRHRFIFINTPAFIIRGELQAMFRRQ